MYAKATLIGRATKDCELSELPSGKTKAIFSIACNIYKDETVYFDITAFDGKAEFCGRNVTKGRLVYLECTIKPRTYEDRDGNKRHTTDYILQEIKLLSSNQYANQKPQQFSMTQVEDTNKLPF